MSLISMPAESSVPPGPHRDLLVALHELYGRAGSPSLRRLSGIDVDGPGTLSHEQVRKILQGKAVPRWQVLETLVLALLSLCGGFPRHPALEVDRFRALWRAADTGEYGMSEMAVHPGAPDSTRGDGSKWVPDDIARLMINPIYAIEIAEDLAFPHEPMFSEEEWIAVNLRTLAEIGPEAYLRTLLDILRGNYIAGGAPEGYCEHGEIDADAADEYVCQQILDRLRSEPGILARSINALQNTPDHSDDPMLQEEVDLLEQRPDVMREVLSASDQTWTGMTIEAQRLILIYLVEKILIGPPGQPIDAQVTIVWRIPQP
ncbi:hypothetical protein [Nocardia sp. NPDC055049]